MSIVRNLAAFHAFAICMDANEAKEWDDVFLKRIFWVDDWAAFVRDTTSNIAEYKEGQWRYLWVANSIKLSGVQVAIRPHKALDHGGILSICIN